MPGVKSVRNVNKMRLSETLVARADKFCLRCLCVSRLVVLFLSSLCFTAALSVHASDSDRNRWQTVTETMSLQEYKQACNDNQRIVRKFLKTSSMDMLDAVGIPETGIRLMGAATGLAANLVTNHDVKLGLNKSRTMSLEFMDPAGQDSSMLLRFKKNW